MTVKANFSFWKARSLVPCFHDPSNPPDCLDRARPALRASRGQKIWRRTLWVWKACNPLKSHKTAKEMFGKAWSETAEIWKGLDKSLELAAVPERRRMPFF